MTSAWGPGTTSSTYDANGLVTLVGPVPAHVVDGGNVCTKDADSVIVVGGSIGGTPQDTFVIVTVSTNAWTAMPGKQYIL